MQYCLASNTALTNINVHGIRPPAMGRLSNLQERPSRQKDSDPDFLNIDSIRTLLCSPTLN